MGDVSKLSSNQVKLLETAFRDFETPEGSGRVSTDQIGIILEVLGIQQTKSTIRQLIDEFDPFGNGDIDFDSFKIIGARFLGEEVNPEQMQQELREAFRLYDKEGNGYISTDVMREILAELDETLSSEDLDAMIDEIDADGSGTVDFEEFMGVMTGGDE
uniref:Troponin C n=2 Tax=Lethocerus indicus TaxID=212017 RepID=Q868D4_LETIN|nr:Chain A, Troponin C [Lethocerus indicus]CAD55595.1 troponin C [Lethocerus indicus]